MNESAKAACDEVIERAAYINKILSSWSCNAVATLTLASYQIVTQDQAHHIRDMLCALAAEEG